MAPFGTAPSCIVLADNAALEPVLLERTLRDRSPELRAAAGIAVAAALAAAVFLAHGLPASEGEISHRTRRAAIMLPATPRGQAVRPHRARHVRKADAAKSTRTRPQVKSAARAPTPPASAPAEPAQRPPTPPQAVTVVRAPATPSRLPATPQLQSPPSSAGEFF